MGGAWVDVYWISYVLGSNPQLIFYTGQISVYPWKYLTGNERFDVIKAQLDSSTGDENWVAIQWNDSTQEVTKITALKYL